MSRLAVVPLFLALFGCGGKKVDCDALAEHVGAVPHDRAPAETEEQYQRRMTTIREGTRMACTSGDIKPEQATCMRAAKDEAGLDACMGTAPVAKPATPPPPPAKAAPPAMPDPDSDDTPENNQKFAAACDGGNGEACYYMAVRINRGVGVGDAELHDYTKLSAPWYQKGCDAGDAWSCEKLAVATLFGDGVDQDKEKATALAQKACTTSDARCGLLAGLHFAGVGVAKDPARGRELLEKACAGKDPDACADLASRLMKGEDMKVDEALAVKIATEACTANQRACWALGDFTIAGQGGVAKDQAKGEQLRHEACIRGGRAGCKRN